MKALVAISMPGGAEVLTVGVDDYDPFAVLTVRETIVQLTRDECRCVADALHAASVRPAHPTDLDLGSGLDGSGA